MTITNGQLASRRAVSLAHLTLIDVPPPELVRVAAEAGYDAVGLRITPVSNGPDHSMAVGSPRLRETVRILRDTGLRVLDAEVVRLRPGTDPAEYEGFLDAVAELGAEHVIVTIEDAHPSRAAAAFAGLGALAADRNITLMLEFMVFSQVRTLEEAQSLVHATRMANAGILIDPLHLARSGGTVEQVRRVRSSLLPYLQICDAPSVAIADDIEKAQEEARRSRLLAGEGVLPLVELVAAMPPEAALSLEVPDGWHNRDPLERARRVLRSAAPLLAG